MKVLTFPCRCEYGVELAGGRVTVRARRLCEFHDREENLDPDALRRYIFYGGQQVSVKGPLELYLDREVPAVLRRCERPEVELNDDYMIDNIEAVEAAVSAARFWNKAVVESAVAMIEHPLVVLEQYHPELAVGLFRAPMSVLYRPDDLEVAPGSGEEGAKERARRAAVRYLAVKLPRDMGPDHDDEWRTALLELYGVRRALLYLATLPSLPVVGAVRRGSVTLDDVNEEEFTRL